MNKEEMVLFLEGLGLNVDDNNIDNEIFCREIKFSVYGIDYKITWYKNESTLKIGSGNRPACIPFRYMYLDTTFPIIEGNRSIGFSYVKNKKTSAFDREYPYEILRIPLEV